MNNILDLEIENNTPDTTDLEGEVYVAGTRGYSAYEVAVRNGYTGTEQEWLDHLVGATPDIDIGNVETGETASATITGTPENPILNLILPRGERGATGITGNGIAYIALVNKQNLTSTYRIQFTNGNTFEYFVTDGKGITSIVKTNTIGLVDTYTITYNDNTTSTYTITNGKDGENGNGIVSIEKTGTTNLVDTYTITFDNGDTTTFSVTNAKSITSIEKVGTQDLVDTYKLTFNDGTTFDYSVTNGNTIDNIEKISTSGLVDTYRISLADGTHFDFVVSNGKSIVSVEKTNTTGLTDTYTITYNDSTTSTFIIVNGKGITKIELASTSGLVDTYTIFYNDGNTSQYTVTNGKDGVDGQDGAPGEDGNGIVSIEKTSTEDNIDTYTITFDDDTTTTFTVTNSTVTDQEFEELQRKVDYYKSTLNALPKVEGEATSLTLDDTAEAPMKMSLGANTEQASITGANLLQGSERSNTYSGVSYNCDANGQLRIRGTYGGGSSIGLSYNTTQLTLQAGTYTFDVIGKYDAYGIQLDGASINFNTFPYTFTITEEKTITVRTKLLSDGIYDTDCYYTLASGNTATTERYTGGIPAPNPDYPQDIHTISGDNEIKVEGKNLFDKSTEVDDYYIDASGNITANSGFAYSALMPVEQTNYILKGTTYETSTKRIHGYNNNGVWVKQVTYEQITANNNYSIPITINDSNIKYIRISIKVADTDVKVIKNSEIANYPLNLPVENLFDKDNAIYKDGYYITSDGSESQNAAAGYIENYISVKPNTQYTLSGKIGNFGYARVCLYDNSKVFISRSDGYSASSYTFKTPSNCYFMRFNYQVSIIDKSTIQIEPGTKANSYTPYGTPALEYSKIGNYEDEFYLATESDTGLTAGKWYLKKNILKVIFDGSETWAKSSNKNRYVTTSKIENIDTYDYRHDIKTICNRFKGIAYADDFILNTTSVYSTNGIKVYFDISDTIVSTVEGWVSLIEQDNIISYFKLATPEYIPLNNTLQSQLTEIYKWVKAYQNQTNISQVNNDLPFRIKVSAIKDLNAVIASLTNAIIEIGGE